MGRVYAQQCFYGEKECQFLDERPYESSDLHFLNDKKIQLTAKPDFMPSDRDNESWRYLLLFSGGNTAYVSQVFHRPTYTEVKCADFVEQVLNENQDRSPNLETCEISSSSSKIAAESARKQVLAEIQSLDLTVKELTFGK